VVLALTVALGWGIGLLDGDGVGTGGCRGAAAAGSDAVRRRAVSR